MAVFLATSIFHFTVRRERVTNVLGLDLFSPRQIGNNNDHTYLCAGPPTLTYVGRIAVYRVFQKKMHGLFSHWETLGAKSVQTLSTSKDDLGYL